MKFENISPQYLKVQATAGTEVTVGLREAIVLALTENIEVKYEHNGSSTNIDPYKIISCVRGGQS